MYMYANIYIYIYIYIYTYAYTAVSAQIAICSGYSALMALRYRAQCRRVPRQAGHAGGFAPPSSTAGAASASSVAAAVSYLHRVQQTITVIINALEPAPPLQTSHSFPLPIGSHKRSQNFVPVSVRSKHHNVTQPPMKIPDWSFEQAALDAADAAPPEVALLDEQSTQQESPRSTALPSSVPMQRTSLLRWRMLPRSCLRRCFERKESWSPCTKRSGH